MDLRVTNLDGDGIGSEVLTGTEWIRYTPETAGAVEDRVEEFESLNNSAGQAAEGFLKKDALQNAGITRTHLCLSETRVEGFFSCCSASVRLSKRSISRLGFRTGITTMPAILVTWVARHRTGTVGGLELMQTAYGLARAASQTIAAAALVLDPMDAEVAEVWKSEPYLFQESEQKRGNGSRRLWLPLDPKGAEAPAAPEVKISGDDLRT
ncbi:MAG TPA: hypothetical protein VF009_06435 [Solirubrobacterales bacterium]